VSPDTQKSYGGAIYLLVGPRNSANTFYFARTAQRHQLATIAGQETGGSMKGINSGQTLYLNLPNSGIVINFPIWGSFASEKQPSHGVMPDYYVEPKLSDLPYLIDTEVEAILNLIEKRVQSSGKVIKP